MLQNIQSFIISRRSMKKLHRQIQQTTLAIKNEHGEVFTKKIVVTSTRFSKIVHY